MNSKQRVKMAIEHKQADRIPIGELAIHTPISGKVLGRETYTGEGGSLKKLQRTMAKEGRWQEYHDKYARDTIDIFCELEIDMIPVELNMSKYAKVEYRDVTENGWTEIDESRGTWAKYKLETTWDVALEIESSFSVGGIDAIRSYVEVLESENKYCDDSQFHVLEKVVDEVGKEKCILAKIPNMFPVGTSWFTNFMELIYDDEELTNRLLLQYQLRAEAVAKRYCQMDGVDAVLNGGDWAYKNGPFLSPKFVKELLAPQVKAISDICHTNGRFLVKHTDGNVMPIADVFFNDMGIDCFQSIDPSAGMDLAEVKRLYGDRITFMGNVDCAGILQSGTAEEIEEDTKRAIDQGSKAGGFILSSSNSIHSAIPPENYLTMLKAARKYGSYTG